MVSRIGTELGDRLGLALGLVAFNFFCFAWVLRCSFGVGSTLHMLVVAHLVTRLHTNSSEKIGPKPLDDIYYCPQTKFGAR